MRYASGRRIYPSRILWTGWRPEITFKRTPNMWVKLEPGQILRNPLAPMVSDLDKLPFSDREGLDSEPLVAGVSA